MNIATIRRDPAHSPNMTDNDAAILRRVEEILAAMGHSVQQVSDDACIEEGIEAVCHMSRDSATLQMLQMAEEKGCIVINSTAAIKNCSRLEQMTILQRYGIAQPAFRHITSKNGLRDAAYPVWIKKSHGWAEKREDVCYATSPDEAAEVLAGIGTDAIFCEHIKGDIIKFYGIEGGFFTYHYPDAEKTKFGLEKINGTPKGYPFNPEELEKSAFKAAEALGLAIFGGDCIIAPDGNIYIIDINDFPSFSPVREEAAQRIAELVVSKKQIKR